MNLAKGKGKENFGGNKAKRINKFFMNLAKGQIN